MKVKEYSDVKKVYSWASAYTAETAIRFNTHYYETEEFKRILFKLENIPNALIGVLGLQGSGKTRMLYELQSRLIDMYNDPDVAVYIKWKKDIYESMKQSEKVLTEYHEKLMDKAKNVLEKYMDMHKIFPKIGRVPREDDLEYFDWRYREKCEEFLPKNERRKLFEESVNDILEGTCFILIDMPDYTKSTAHRMNADIDKVQWLWQKLRNSASFVIAFQKEMVMKHPHFFIGKMDLITLKPLTPKQLVEAYKMNNNTVQPFTEKSLHLIAELSRGIFRRFLKYIQITIEKNMDADIPLTIEHVNRAITEDLLIEDMELELGDIFKTKEKIAEAVRILNFLREHKECNVKTLARELDLSESLAQRLIRKLETYRYINVRRGKGKEKLVSLKV